MRVDERTRWQRRIGERKEVHKEVYEEEKRIDTTQLA